MLGNTGWYLNNGERGLFFRIKNCFPHQKQNIGIKKITGKEGGKEGRNEPSTPPPLQLSLSPL